MKNFGDRLYEAIEKKGNNVCVGLDPRYERIPKHLVSEVWDAKKSPLELAADVILEFNKRILDAVADLVPVCKPQSAFYELYGSHGMRAFEETIKYAKDRGLIVIADVKRGDIGSTAEAYAKALLGEVELFGEEDEIVLPVFDADAVTVAPYMGWDSVKPFLVEAEKYGKGVFVLDKTSNPTSGDIQDLPIEGGVPLYEIVGGYIDSWGADYVGKNGYSSLGAVVGATYPDQLSDLRKIMPNNFFLIPGYGEQGGTAADVKRGLDDKGMGTIVNSSRGIIFAYEKSSQFKAEYFAEAARDAVIKMIRDLNS